MTVRFINQLMVGTVYVGTKKHMEGLAREGGIPEVIGNEPVLEPDGQVWKVIKAPAHWAYCNNDYNNLWDTAKAPDKKRHHYDS